MVARFGFGLNSCESSDGCVGPLGGFGRELPLDKLGV